MARYTGPKTKISRRFGEPILGNGKWLDKNSNPPGNTGVGIWTFKELLGGFENTATGA